MRTSRPHGIAAWILDRFGPMPETEAIAGDLIEQYQQGRSRWWYWREVVVALAVTFVWPFLLPIPLLTVLVLFGGGLLTGSPKRSIRT